jgi:hypothetical protein
MRQRRFEGLGHRRIGRGLFLRIDFGCARPAGSPDTRAAIDYLAASGASDHHHRVDGVCTISIGHNANPNAISVQWTSETLARSIVRQARHDAGRSPDAAKAVAGARPGGGGLIGRH